MEGVFVLLVFGFIGAIIAAAIRSARRRAERLNKTWGEVAQKFELQLEPGATFSNPRLVGYAPGGHLVRIDVKKDGSGEDATTYLRTRADFQPALPLAFRLGKQGFFQNVGRMFGIKDLEVGDWRFDGNIKVEGVEEEWLRNFLTEQRRSAVIELVRSADKYEITETEVEVLYKQKPDKGSQVAAKISRLFSFLDSFVGSDNESSLRVPSKEPPRDEDHRPDSVLIEPPFTPSAEFSDREPRFEVPAEIPLGRPVEPSVDLPVDLPVDPSVDLPIEPSFEPLLELPVELPVAPPIEPPIVSPVELPALDVVDAIALDVAPSLPSAVTFEKGVESAALCLAALYPADAAYADTGAVFESEYLNAHVEWTGTLKRLNNFSTHLVFGMEPGVLAVVELNPDRPGIYSGRRAEAHVQLPSGASSSLESRVGHPFAFSGRLARCDAFMRKIYVAEGSALFD